jgi:hypothetical protein
MEEGYKKVDLVKVQISFVNQAFLGLQIFQVQGRNHAFWFQRPERNMLDFLASPQT